jgi:predicted RNA binding protein YcfA (HicA-like mRNA interferase family)
MPRLPVLKPHEVARILERLGFVEVRQRGSHKQYRHAGRDISPILLRQIARDIGVTVDELLRHR